MPKTVTEARQPDTAAGADAIYRSLFDSFNPDKDGRISPLEVLSRLERSGLQPDDPRIAEALTGLAGADGGSRQISFTQFKALARHNSSLIRRAVEGNLAVPDFAALTADITRMHDELLSLRSGTVAGYIPQLKRVDPDQLAIAVCTVDGQRFCVGDAATAFSLQSVSKTVSYCLALDEHGTEEVHRHVGREPSGRSFNELALNPKGLPHNPMVNAGGIMTCSLRAAPRCTWPPRKASSTWSTTCWRPAPTRGPWTAGAAPRCPTPKATATPRSQRCCGGRPKRFGRPLRPAYRTDR